MSKQSQKEAVFTAVKTVVEATGNQFVEGESYADRLTDQMRKQIVDIIENGLITGETELNTSFDTSTKLRNYASCLLSNWVRKDARLNGGGKYAPAKTGITRARDPQIKAMKALLASGQVTAQEDIDEINAFILTRQAELDAQKKPSIKVDFNLLPESLRDKFAQQTT